MKILLPLLVLFARTSCLPEPDSEEKDGDSSRKLLGSSVVTSVSVIMDTGNGTQIIDAVGKPLPKPHGASPVASPINLLNPDRYEFFTFNDNGELIKRLMTLEEIQGIIANGDGEDVNYNVAEYLPEKKVNDIVSNVQNVLKEQMINHKQSENSKPILDTPDVSNTWSMILPAFFGNTGEEIAPDKPISVTADTVMITDDISTKIKEFEKLTTPLYNGGSSSRPITSSSIKPTTSSTTLTASSTNITPSTKNLTTSSTTLTPSSPHLTPSSTKPVPSSTKSNPPTTVMPSSTNATFPSTKPAHHSTLTTLPYISSTMELLRTTALAKTSTTTRPPSTSTHYAKLTTEQYVGNFKPSTTESTTASKTEATSEVPLITVAIISHTKYNTTNLEESNNSPTVSILPVEEVFNDRPTTVVIKPTESELRTTPIVEQKLKISTKPAEMYTTTPIVATLGDINTNDYIPINSSIPKLVPTSTSTTFTTNIPSSTKETSPTTVETSVKAETTQQATTAVKKTTTSTGQIQGTTHLPSTSTKLDSVTTKIPETTIFSTTTQSTITSNEETTLKFTPSAIIEDQPTEVKLLTTQESLPSTLFSTTQELNVASKLPENESFSPWSSVKTNPVSSTTPLTVSKEENTSQNVVTKLPQITLTPQRLKEELLQSTTFNNLAALKSTTPIWIIIKRKPEPPVQNFGIAQDKVVQMTSSTDQNAANPVKQGDKNSLKDQTNQGVESLNKLEGTSNDGKVQILNNVEAQSSMSENVQIEPEIIQSTPSVQKIQKTSSTQKVEPTTEIPTTLPELTELIELKNMPLHLHSPLTSTKIYEINTQLSQKFAEHTSERLPTTLSENLTYESPEITTQSIEETTSYTTPPSLIESIHQLLLQTANNIEEPIVNVNANEKIEEMLSSMKDKPMQDVQNEAATVGSSLETINDDSNTSDVTEYPTTISAEVAEFSEAVSSVLSQIYALDGTTTIIDDFSNTEPVAELTTVPMDKATFETTTLKVVENETEVPLEVLKDENLDSKEEDVNLKEPVKADEGVEIQLIHQEVKNDLEIKKNVSKDGESAKPFGEKIKIENENVGVSSIPYGQKLTTREVVTTPKINYNEESLPVKDKHSWTLVSTISPPNSPSTQPLKPSPTTPPPIKLPNQPFHGFGLEETTSKLDTDVYQFVELCNELSFGFWTAVTNGISSVRSIFVSPFAATSLLAMVFLGARGATSGEMNEILKLDDMVTFNPHLTFKNVSESIESGKGTGVAVSVIARELYSDRSKGKLLSFYKERAKQFYDGFVEEVNFKEIGDVVRRRTNLIVKKNSGGKIQEYLKDSSITLRPPLAGVSASIFETDCTPASTEGRDGELHFVVLPSIRQRKLVPIPAVVYRSGFLAGYDPQLDATAAAIGRPDQVISTIFVIPGQQGIAAPGDGLLRLERQLAETAFKKGSWGRLLRSLIPRPGLELQIPRFMHKSIINSTVALQRMGLKDLFSFDKADLKGLNGQAHELHLSDVLQLNTFATCGENFIGEDHHTEIYPATSRRPSRRSRKLGFYLPESVFAMENGGNDEPRDYQRSFDDPLHDPDLLSLPLPLRPRQARLPDAPRLRFDRPFLFFIRHNPTGLILHMGRFNPRLLP